MYFTYFVMIGALLLFEYTAKKRKKNTHNGKINTLQNEK
jgi:hypothetical protein